MKDYSGYLIKDYKYWSVQVHSNQSYLGRCIVWCKRENALDLPDATKEEQTELFEILQKIKSALNESFSPNMLNYSFLGNETRHLHGRIIPRYSNPVKFNGLVFTDKNWGHNYKTDSDFVTTKELLEAVKEKIKENLK